MLHPCGCGVLPKGPEGTDSLSREKPVSLGVPTYCTLSGALYILADLRWRTTGDEIGKICAEDQIYRTANGVIGCMQRYSRLADRRSL